MQKRVINLIPAAGSGKRFSDAGYLLPKPLIPVSGLPMIAKACESLPKPDKWVFLLRKEHLEKSDLAEVLGHHFNPLKIISVDHLTEGQASTCALGFSELNDDDSVLVAPCDNAVVCNKDGYQKLLEDLRVDAVIWTFRNNATVKRNPQMYGWVEVNSTNKALRVSCKKPVSDNPICDHAIIGTFYFRRALDLKEGYQNLVSKNRRINGEFYVDELMNELIEKGLHVVVFEVDQYICWGTPDDLKTYEYWESFFTKNY